MRECDASKRSGIVTRGLISYQQKDDDNFHNSATHKIQLVKCLRQAAHKLAEIRRNLSKGSTLKFVSAPLLSLCRHIGKFGNKKVMKITLCYRRTISKTQVTAHSRLPHDATVADSMAAGIAVFGLRHLDTRRHAMPSACLTTADCRSAQNDPAPSLFSPSAACWSWTG